MNNTRNRGFTLVELIVALSLFAMLLGGIFYAWGVELNFWKRAVASVEKQQVANMVLARIVRDIRNAGELLPASDDHQLLLKIGSDTIEYSLVNQKIRRKKNSYSAYLTSEGELKALSFAYPDARLVEIKVEGFTTRTALRN
jgi:prepilin-type N-terminal cleavage/methylation domain-containing protein